MFIDTHTHLHSVQYDSDREAVLARMREAGVVCAVTIGTSVVESRAAVALADMTHDVFATVGLHPHVFNGGAQPEGEAGLEWDAQLGADVDMAVRCAALDVAIAELEMIARDSVNVVAVGECGLDYFSHDVESVITDAQRAWQKEGFVAQIELARRLNLPVVVHGRPSARGTDDAYEDIADIIAAHGDVRFVLHCYMGGVAVTERFVVLSNVVFSFAGNVTYGKKNQEGPMDPVLRMVPLARLLVETDGPYLTPVPHRGGRNESAYVAHTAAYIARIKMVEVEEFARVTSENARRFFGLGGNL